jgi:hypothetical protein
VRSQRFLFSGQRADIRLAAILAALDMLDRML